MAALPERAPSQGQRERRTNRKEGQARQARAAGRGGGGGGVTGRSLPASTRSHKGRALRRGRSEEARNEPRGGSGRGSGPTTTTTTPIPPPPPSAGMSCSSGGPSPPARRCRDAVAELAMVLLSAVGPGAARLFFYPTLLYTLVRERLPGSQRPWFSRIDHAVLLGALPLKGRCRQLVEEENVRGVVTMNEEYETRFLCCSPEEWKAMGVEQLRLSTVDLTGVPSLENLHKGVEFVLKHRERGNSVYVHCKAGRFRSATMVAAYLIQVHQWTPQEAIEAIAKIRPHIIVRSKQVQLLEDFHKCVTLGTPVQSQEELQDEEQKLPQHSRNTPRKTAGS